MAELKTQKNDADVDDFLASVEPEQRREDAKAVRELMAAITGDRGAMWGSSIVGFGTKTTTYANGTTGQWMAIGFSPRKANLVLYIMDGFDKYEPLLADLGKHSTGKACLYIKKLADVDTEVLSEMITISYASA